MPPSPEAIRQSAIVPILPATFFAMVLGIGGLASAWRIAARVWRWPMVIGDGLALLATLLWALWLGMFIAKCVMSPAAARAEANDPAMSFGLGLLPMATLLVSVLIKPWTPGLAELIFDAGLLGGAGVAVWLMARAWQGGRAVAATTPLMYLSPVGAGFLGALGAGAFGHSDLALLLWGAGAISWLLIEAAVLQRLMSEGMPVPMRALIGIQLAPPAVACMSYLGFTGEPPDRLALMIFGYALLQGLILLRLVRWLQAQPFGPGAWAYTFGIAALAGAALMMVERGQAGVVAWLAPLLFALANLLIGWIAVRTAMLAVAGKLFPTPKP